MARSRAARHASGYDRTHLLLRPGAARAEDGPPPVRFAYDLPTWKEITHLLANLPMSLIGFVYVVTVLTTGAGLTVTVVGLPLLAAGLTGSRQLGRLERTRVRSLLGTSVEEPSPLPLARTKGPLNRLWLMLKDPVAWRAALYGLIRLPGASSPSPSP